MPKKFTLEFLNQICSEKKMTLLKNYLEDELNSQKFIDFKCIKCNENTSKKFEFIIKYDAICHICSYNQKGIKARNTTLIKYGVKNISQLDYIKNKKKETTFKNYGVEHNSRSEEIREKCKLTCLKNHGVEYPMQSEEIRNKGKLTCFTNYGVEYPTQCLEIRDKCKITSFKNYGVEHNSQSEEIREKCKITCLKNYGVEYPFQSGEIREKSKITCLKNYGVEHPAQSAEIKDKCKITCLKNYGVEYPFQSAEIKDKCKITSFKKYGVDHPQQNSEIAEKASKNCYKSKLFIFPSGNEIKCQGYEPFALQELIENNINEIDIKTGAKNVPTIWYNDIDGKKHRHYVDIFIPSQNKCIEVKSTWTEEKKNDCIFLKQNAAKKIGYDYEIWVYDKKGNRLITHI
jgi:hypothetical protein